MQQVTACGRCLNCRRLQERLQLQQYISSVLTLWLRGLAAQAWHLVACRGEREPVMHPVCKADVKRAVGVHTSGPAQGTHPAI